MKRNDWKEILEKWQGSGLNMTDFCHEEGLNYWTFRDWKSRLLYPVSSGEKSLVKLNLNKPLDNQENLKIELIIGGIRILVPIGFSEPHLLRLISVLEKA